MIDAKEAQCQQCGKKFLPKTRRNKFCSDICCDRGYKKRQRVKNSKTKEPRPCRNCGNVFQPRVGNQFYCTSDPCKQRSRRVSYTNSAEKYRERNKTKEYMARWRSRNPSSVLYRAAKNRAKTKGIEFTIEVSDVVVPNTCPVLGIEISIGGNRNNSPSLDRIDNSKGYVKGNVCVISFRANALKSDGTLEELRAISRYMEERLK